MLEVVAALIFDENRFLICRRPEGKARAGLWEFPGGKVEAGETRAQALARECAEELSVTVSVEKEAMDTVYAYPDVTVHLTLLSARITHGRPRPLEGQTICWIAPGELADYSFCPADARFIEKLYPELVAGR